MLFAVVEHVPVQHDAAPIRGLDARDAFERIALAAAGGPQQAGDPLRRIKFCPQGEMAQPLFDIHLQTHDRAPFFCRASSRFTASSTTALMARLTITQKKAPPSSLVRHS